jgi:hypothetical protein
MLFLCNYRKFYFAIKREIYGYFLVKLLILINFVDQTLNSVVMSLFSQMTVELSSAISIIVMSIYVVFLYRITSKRRDTDKPPES